MTSSAPAAAVPATMTFTERVAELRRFVDENDRLPRRDENDIGRWIVDVRRRFKENKLSSERVDMLQAVPHWKWSASEVVFASRQEEVRAFVERVGRLPNVDNVGEMTLGAWVNMQRRSFRRGTMTSERIAALQSILGWTWMAPERRPTAEDAPAPAAVPAAEDAPAPAAVPAAEDAPAPAAIPAAEDDTAPAAPAAMPAAADQFQAQLDMLRRFVTEHQRLPRSTEANLGQWIADHRRMYRNGTLSRDEMEALEAVQFWRA